jgi:hypothetical protein
LATTGPAEGWFEATVGRADDDALLTLKWRDWPKYALFAQRRWQVALLPRERAAP